MSITILLADDHKILREGIRSLIEKELGFEVVGEAGNGRSAVQMAAQLKPNVVLMDVSMPDMGGIEATREIVENHPDIKVLALTMVKEKRYVVRMLQAGASGYLIKDCAFDEMAGAIRAVVSGGKYLCKEVTGVVIDDFRRIHADDEVPSSRQITAREREVLILLAQGQTTKNIADRLHLSVKTVETHRRKLMEKLKVKSIADLTRWAIREGLIDID